MTSYLLLGATGFLGRQVRRAIGREEPGARVVAVSRRPLRGSDEDGLSVDLIGATVAELAELVADCSPDVVVNCVGRTTGADWELDAANTRFVVRLAAAMERCASARLVHLGSAAEYGGQPAEKPIAETARPWPTTSYGRSKLAGTEHLVGRAQAGALRATVLRVFNPVGPGAPESTLAGRAARRIEQALAVGCPTVTLGPLDAVRDFVATDDVAGAVLAAGRCADAPPVLNVGSGVGRSCRAVVELLAGAAGYLGEIEEQSEGSPRSTGVPWQQADLSLAERALGWRPQTPIADAVTALWLSRN